MKRKEEIKELIKLLEAKGYPRREIEKTLAYKEFFIDQTVSRGGNDKILASLNLLLQYATLKKQDNVNAISAEVADRISSMQANLDSLKELLSISSDDPKKAGLRKLRNPGVNRPAEIPSFGGKSKAHDQDQQEGNIRSGGNKNKG